MAKRRGIYFTLNPAEEPQRQQRRKEEKGKFCLHAVGVNVECEIWNEECEEVSPCLRQEHRTLNIEHSTLNIEI